jgi:hypothetical protein
MHDNKTEAKYRSLVLGHLCIAARKLRTSVAKLPPEELERLGVEIVREGTLTRFQVTIPERLNGNLSGVMRELEAEMRENASMFSEGPKKKNTGGKANWKKRMTRIAETPIVEDLAGFDD